MLRILLIFSLGPLFLGCRAEDLTDCDCTNTTNTCLLEDDAFLELKERSEILNTSQELVASKLEELTNLLEEQSDLIEDLNTQSARVSSSESNLFSLWRQLGRTGNPPGYRSCWDAYSLFGETESKFYEITQPLYKGGKFKVWCSMNEGRYGGGWTRILHRSDASISFNRTWEEYQEGFGEGTNMFIGLDKLHAMTTESPQSLLVVLTDLTKTNMAEYAFFAIGGKTEDYALKVIGNFKGDAGDSLTYHQGMKFSTFDNMNEKFSNNDDCKDSFYGGWWFKDCYKSNLNGRYYTPMENPEFGGGLVWETMISKQQSLVGAEMLIRKATYAGCFLRKR